MVTIEYSPSQRIIVSAGFDHDVFVWSPVTGQVLFIVHGGNRFAFFFQHKKNKIILRTGMIFVSIVQFCGF